MYVVPEDIKTILKMKWNNINIDQFINDLFSEIINKTINDGSCTIKSFGRFVAYKSFSQTTGKYFIRFKFIITPTLLKRFKNDDYIFNTLKTKLAKSHETDIIEQRCAEFKEQKEINRELKLIETKKTEKEKTSERLAKLEILKLLQEEDDQ